MQIEQDRGELIYVGDPMCSWCWGIAPELESLQERRPDLGFRVVVGGLRPGPNAEEMTEGMARYLGHHWRQVTARSGQRFDHSILERRGWSYDTEPACKAVVVMRRLAPDLAWPLFKRLQQAFYAEGIVISDPETIPALVGEFDVDVDAFMESFGSTEAARATWSDFATARSWGISGFPTVIVRVGEHAHVVARGYAPVDELETALTRFVGDSPSHSCPPGQMC